MSLITMLSWGSEILQRGIPKGKSLAEDEHPEQPASFDGLPESDESSWAGGQSSSQSSVEPADSCSSSSSSSQSPSSSSLGEAQDCRPITRLAAATSIA